MNKIEKKKKVNQNHSKASAIKLNQKLMSLKPIGVKLTGLKLWPQSHYT